MLDLDGRHEGGALAQWAGVVLEGLELVYLLSTVYDCGCKVA